MCGMLSVIRKVRIKCTESAGVVMIQPPVTCDQQLRPLVPNCIMNKMESVALLINVLGFWRAVMMHYVLVFGKKTTSITVTLPQTCLDLGELGCYDFDDWTLVSGSYPYTHVPSPVIIDLRNSEPRLAHYSMSSVKPWAQILQQLFASPKTYSE